MKDFEAPLPREVTRTQEELLAGSTPQDLGRISFQEFMESPHPLTEDEARRVELSLNPITRYQQHQAYRAPYPLRQVGIVEFPTRGRLVRLAEANDAAREYRRLLEQQGE